MERLVPWLTLKCVPGIGNRLFHRLVNQFGSPEHVLQASEDMLTRVPGISPRLASAVTGQRPPDWVFDELDRCGRKGVGILTLHDAAYPALLLNIPDPPPVLYCCGRMERNWCHIAVVGARRATAYGKSTARRLCRDLSAAGISIVSGMARGIDTAAHLGAMDGGGPTVAVLGSGLDRIYPAANSALAERIAENGAVLSEFVLDAEPEPHHFPQRNRIISGMALGTVVVEAAKRSGSLITARLAAEQGREVYAVPGNIQAPTTRGTHGLIRQGAKLVENVRDVIEEIIPHVDLPAAVEGRTGAGHRGPQGSLPLKKDQQAVFNAIAFDPIHIDELVRRCKMTTGAVTAILGELELMGAIVQEPGKYFLRSGDEARPEAQ